MTLAYQESGQPGHPAVVLLHGGGVSGWSWDLQLPALSAYHVLVPDLPEHGRSGDNPLLSVAQIACEVAEMIEAHIPAGKAHVAGLSLGGQTLLDLLACYPERLLSALMSGVLVSPPGKASIWARPIPRVLLLATVGSYMPIRNMPWLVQANMKSLGVPPQFEAQIAADTRRLTAAGFIRLRDANQHFPLPDLARAGSVPALVLAGEREQKAILASQRQILKALPNAQGGLVRGVRHNWPLEAPELFNRTLLAWLEGQPLPAEVQLVTS